MLTCERMFVFWLCSSSSACFCLQIIFVTECSLLVGVGFALTMIWAESGHSCRDVSRRTCFATPCSAWLIMSNCDPHFPFPFPLLPPSSVFTPWVQTRLRPCRWDHLGFICEHVFAGPRAHTHRLRHRHPHTQICHTRWYQRGCGECNAMFRNVMPFNPWDVT